MRLLLMIALLLAGCATAKVKQSSRPGRPVPARVEHVAPKLPEPNKIDAEIDYKGPIWTFITIGGLIGVALTLSRGKPSCA